MKIEVLRKTNKQLFNRKLIESKSELGHYLIIQENAFCSCLEHYYSKYETPSPLQIFSKKLFKIFLNSLNTRESVCSAI